MIVSKIFGKKGTHNIPMDLPIFSPKGRKFINKRYSFQQYHPKYNPKTLDLVQNI